MTYFKVIDDSSYRHPVTRQWEDPYKNELLTEREQNIRMVPTKQLEMVQISRRKTYTFFGKRFSY